MSRVKFNLSRDKNTSKTNPNHPYTPPFKGVIKRPKTDEAKSMDCRAVCRWPAGWLAVLIFKVSVRRCFLSVFALESALFRHFLRSPIFTGFRPRIRCFATNGVVIDWKKHALRACNKLSWVAQQEKWSRKIVHYGDNSVNGKMCRKILFWHRLKNCFKVRTLSQMIPRCASCNLKVISFKNRFIINQPWVSDLQFFVGPNDCLR